MLAAIGEILPLALGTALSPLPLIAIVFLVLSTNGTGRSLGFMAGRLLGIALTLTILTLAAEAMPESREATLFGGILKIALGLGLVYLAVSKWRKRPQGDTKPAPPGWMLSLDTISTPRAFGLGLLVTAINPKELAFALGAAISIGAAHQPAGPLVVLELIYIVHCRLHCRRAGVDARYCPGAGTKRLGPCPGMVGAQPVNGCWRGSAGFGCRAGQ